MHILKSDLIAVDVSQVILECLDSVWPIVLFRALLSEVADDYTIVHFLFSIPEVSGTQITIGKPSG